MPAERTKKTKTPESVPDVGDPERKRLLNVLAQRRYRQRRREKIEALEAQAKGIPSPEGSDKYNANLKPTLDTSPSVDTSSPPDAEEEEVIEAVFNNMEEASLSLFDFTLDPLDLSLLPDFITFPSPNPSHALSPLPHFPLTPDGALLQIPILSALNAFATIAIALDVSALVWDPSYLHVLPANIPALSSLPRNLHPIAAQHTIPHHPVIDLLPWPSVREKLICMLSMPSFLRPPVARQDDDVDVSTSAALSIGAGVGGGCVKQSQAIVQLQLDLDDFQDGGGVRVHGNSTTWSEGNELLEEAWEIGEKFYRKWWWCLDPQVVEISNKKRRERGLGRLRMVA